MIIKNLKTSLHFMLVIFLKMVSGVTPDNSNISIPLILYPSIFLRVPLWVDTLGARDMCAVIASVSEAIQLYFLIILLIFIFTFYFLFP